MYNCVKQFTMATSKEELPTNPRMLTRKEVEFIVSMVSSEMQELLETVCVNREDCTNTMKRLITVDIKPEIRKPRSERIKIADQADAFVDAMYYICDTAAKANIDLDKGFEEVHGANMRKVDPITGKVSRRESDGKVIKPEGWYPPCLEKVYFPACKEVNPIGRNMVSFKRNSICTPEEAEWFDVEEEFESSEPPFTTEEA